ncbi:MAG: flagellar hook-basal body complex protein FliE [Acidobacteria bacterium]|nr:flagellar hook-basal body complex protein FliE [Acidobacteriota bacterium]
MELLGTTGTAAARVAGKRAQSTVSGTGGMSFGESLGKLIEGVEQSGNEANEAISKMLDKSGEVHDAMIALQRAEMALQLTVQIRNKLVQAYQDIMRMPI